MLRDDIFNKDFNLEYLSKGFTNSLLAKFKKYGAIVIYNFINREACEELLVEANKHKSNTIRYVKWYTPFNEKKLEKKESKSFHSKFSLEVCDYSQIFSTSIFRSIYDSSYMLNFIKYLTHISDLKRYNDPGAALNLTFMSEGDCVGWHFDTCDIVVALILQMPEAGGDLIFSRNNRSDYYNNENHVFDIVTRPSCQTFRIPYNTGSLVIFEGRHSLHQVRAIKGVKERVVALMSYDKSEFSRVTRSLNETRYIASRRSS